MRVAVWSGIPGSSPRAACRRDRCLILPRLALGTAQPSETHRACHLSRNLRSLMFPPFLKPPSTFPQKLGSRLVPGSSPWRLIANYSLGHGKVSTSTCRLGKSPNGSPVGAGICGRGRHAGFACSPERRSNPIRRPSDYTHAPSQ